MRLFCPYPYVSHLVLLPPDTAEVSLDLVYFRLAVDGPRSGTSGLPFVPVRCGRLELAPPNPPSGPRRGYGPCRALRGTLYPARARGIAVELELLPWSATKSELALIAGSTRRPSLVAGDRYLRVAH